MNHVFFRANGNRRAILFEEGVAVLSRFPILDSVGIALPPKAGFFENRVALHARLQTPRTVLDVVCTHLAERPRGSSRATSRRSGRIR